MVGVEDMVLAMGWRKMRARGYAKNEARGRWRDPSMRKKRGCGTRMRRVKSGAGACVGPKNAKAFASWDKSAMQKEGKSGMQKRVDRAGERAERVCGGLIVGV